MASIEILGWLLVASLIACSIGFIRTVWFISVGYAASVVLFALITAVLWSDRLVAVAIFQCLAALAWGLRLGTFLLARERQAPYQETVRDQTERSQSLPLKARVGIWLSVSPLYVCMFSPVVFLTDAAPSLDESQTLLATIGVGVMWFGLILEAVADHQKSRQKSVDPTTFASKGLYSWVRYPNYLGEILFWLGSFAAGLVAYGVWWHWVMAITGALSIVFIMLGSTKRMEAKRAEGYASDPRYREYVETVPVIIPWSSHYALKSTQKSEASA